ncbi:MAG: hypothetical protein P4L33_03820 [Capsulimonadaceae bacterium]|nr:hypothetical protein [Capsulimonadaceae bacterium]
MRTPSDDISSTSFAQPFTLRLCDYPADPAITASMPGSNRA